MDHLFPREQLGGDGRDDAVLDRHVVLTGDFNTTPDSEVCQVIYIQSIGALGRLKVLRCCTMSELTGRCADERFG
jgi:hypothetical protein